MAFVREKFRNPQEIVHELTKMFDGWKRYYGFLNPIDQFSQIDKRIEKAFISFAANRIKKGHWKDGLPEGLQFPMLVADNNQDEFKKMQSIWQQAVRISRPANVEKIKKAIDVRVSKRRRQYHRERSQETDLIVTTPGHFIGKRGERVIVRINQNLVTEVPAIRLTGLTIGARGVAISGDVIELCMDKDIYIHFIDGAGRVIAVIRPPGGSSGEISLLQLKERNTKRGLDLAKMFVLGKAKNQLALLKYYHKYRVNRENSFGKAFMEKQTQMENLIRKIRNLHYNCNYDSDLFRQQLMGIEGVFASHYWAIVRHLFNSGIVFEGRERYGAKDIVNSSLNYGYGILYSRVLNALIRIGMNPMSGFLHSFQEGKPILAYDLIEEFRPMVVDRGVFTLFRRGEKLFLSEDGMLAPESRKKICRAIIRRLTSETLFKGGKRVTIEDVIKEQALNIKKHLSGTQTYRPFVSRW